MMKRRRPTPEQIIRKLAEGNRLLACGAELYEVCRHLQVAESTWHRWVAQYGGLKANDAKRLKELEGENARLKRLVAVSAPSHRNRASRLRLASGSASKDRMESASAVVCAWVSGRGRRLGKVPPPGPFPAFVLTSLHRRGCRGTGRVVARALAGVVRAREVERVCRACGGGRGRRPAGWAAGGADVRLPGAGVQPYARAGGRPARDRRAPCRSRRRSDQIVDDWWIRSGRCGGLGPGHGPLAPRRAAARRRSGGRPRCPPRAPSRTP